MSFFEAGNLARGWQDWTRNNRARGTTRVCYFRHGRPGYRIFESTPDNLFVDDAGQSFFIFHHDDVHSSYSDDMVIVANHDDHSEACFQQQDNHPFSNVVPPNDWNQINALVNELLDEDLALLKDQYSSFLNQPSKNDISINELEPTPLQDVSRKGMNTFLATQNHWRKDIILALKAMLQKGRLQSLTRT